MKTLYLLSHQISFLEFGRSVSSPPVFFSPHSWCPYSGALTVLVYSVLLTCGGGQSTQFFGQRESKAHRLISFSSLSESLLPLKFRRHVTSLSIFYCYFHSDCCSELVNWTPPPSGDLAVHAFLLMLILLLFKSLMSELTGIFTLSSLLLVNSGTIFLCLYFLLPTTLTLWRGEFQDTSSSEIDLCFLLLLFIFIEAASSVLFFVLFFSLPLSCFLYCKKKINKNKTARDNARRIHSV